MAFHHSVMRFGGISAWVSDWNLAVGDHKGKKTIVLSYNQHNINKTFCGWSILTARWRELTYLVIFGDYLSPLLVKFHRRILLGIRRWRANRGRREKRWSVSTSFNTNFNSCVAVLNELQTNWDHTLFGAMFSGFYSMSREESTIFGGFT